jgi:hypothetical protein
LQERVKQERAQRGIWKTWDRTTRTLKPVLVADMEDTHLLSAIAYCRRRAAELLERGDRGIGTVEELIHLRWPAFPYLTTEARRRFGEGWETHLTIWMMERDARGGQEAVDAAQQDGEQAALSLRERRRLRAIRVREEESI